MERISILAVALLLAWLIVTLFAKNGPNRWGNKILGFVPIALSLYLAIHNTYHLWATGCMFFPDKIPGSKGMHLTDFCPSQDTWLFYAAMPVPYIFHFLFFVVGAAFLRGWGGRGASSSARRDRRSTP